MVNRNKVQQIRRLYAANLSCAIIGKCLRLSSETVRKVLLNLHISRSRPSQRGQRRKQHGNEKPGSKHVSNGYVLVSSHKHPFCNCRGYVLEHRLVMEQQLGRYLLPWEDVHHINENTLDNHSKNLKLFSSRSAHIRQHNKVRSHRHGDN
jgi:hypothetical protein